MFIGRERELASLKEFYDRDGIGMTVIYGRRRIGKSTLIAEFVKDKKAIFYTATKYSLQGTTQGNGLTGGLPPVRFSM